LRILTNIKNIFMNKITLGFFLAKSKTTIKGLLLLFVLLLINTQASWGQTPVPMSSQVGLSYTESFADITNWTNNFAAGTGANRWASYPITTGGSANDGKRTTKSSATFSTTTGGGVQKGTGNLVFLSTSSSSPSEAVAVDFLLDFTGVNAGTLTFNWAAIDNSSGTRPTSLRVYWSTDNITFTEINAAQVIDIQSISSGSITTVALPTNFNNSATARLRFYNHAGTITGSGNRDKISIDDVTVTAVSSGAASPTLTADTSSNSVDNPIDITFTDDSVWRGLAVVKIGGTTLSSGTDYDLTAGNLQLKPSGLNTLLTASGSKSVTVVATGYSDATVTQVINAGVPTANSTAVISAALAQNTTRTITCTAKDQYNNLVSGYTFKYDATITNNDGTTSESYILDGTAQTATATDISVAATTNASGVATFTAALPLTIDGNDGISIQAQLSDGTTNIGSALSFTQLASQTITFGALTPVTYGGATFGLTATASSTLPVTYASSNTAVASVLGSTVTIVGAGSTNITASQAGNGSYNAATNVIQSLTVNTIALTLPDAAATSRPYNGLLTTDITGTLTGIINSDDVTLVGTLTGTFGDANVANGIAVTANCTLAGTKAGNYSLTQPTGLTANITQASQTITFGTLANKTTVDSPFALLATASSALAVTYVSSNTAVATVSGSTVTIVGAGSTTFTASQIGNGNYAAATPFDQVLLVNSVVYLNQFTGLSACPTNGNVPSVLTNVSGTPLTRNTSTCTAIANLFNTTTLNNTASVNDASYIEFSATAGSGYRLNLTSLSFYRQGSGTAPNSLEVRYSTDGFATSTSWGAAPVTPASGTVATWDFADFSSANAGTVTFRIYPYGTQRTDLNVTAAASTGTFRLDDVTIGGTVSCAPPTITLSNIDDVSPLATSFSIPYTATTGSPSTYSITTASTSGTSIAMPGFIPVPDTAIGSSPIIVAIPASVAAEYGFNLTLINTTTGCTSVTPFQFHVTALNHGVIGTDQTICSGTAPAALTNETSATGAGTITYTWEQSTTGLATGYSTIDGATDATYSPGVLTQTTYFTRVAHNATETSDAVPVTITVNPLSAVGSVAGNQTICGSSLSSDLSIASAAGTIQWQSADDTLFTTNLANIGADATTLTIAQAGTLTATKYFRAVVTSGACAPVTSGTVIVNVINGSGPETAIPDSNFELALIGLGLDCVADNKVFTSNISGVTELIIEAKGIADLTGIGAFSSLQDLYCADNALSSLNVSMLSNLRFLDCQNNALTSLNITGLNNLTQMVCWVNNLSTLNLSSTPNLVYLDCDDNAFTSLDVSKLPNLNQFYCSGNQLTSLDVRGLTNLVKYGDNPGNFECTDNFILNTTTPSLTCILVDDVLAANTATTTIDPTNDPQSPYWKKDAAATYSYCGCGLPPTTWNGATWNNGAPISTQDAIIAGPYSQSAPITACSLTINSNAVVVIPSGTNVTLNAPIMVTSGSFTLENNANLIQTNKNSINSGVITVNRNSNSLYRLDYTMWSSPVAGQNLLAFSPLTTVIASPPSSRFYNYDETTNFYTTIANPSATAFAKGAGYLIRMPNEDPSNLGGGSPYSLGTATITYNGVFTGVPNNGDVPVTLNYVDALHGYNMVGNPYPSTIDANKFIADNTTNIESTLYFWRKTNGSGTAYAAYNPAGGVLTYPSTTSGTPNGTIQVGQGFFVLAKSAGPIANFFTNAMRLGTSSTQFFKTKQVVEKNRVWLNLTNTTGVFSQALVAYITDATQGVDMYDGKYINDSPIALTSIINNEEYTIQGRPTFDASDVVALNFKTTLAGDYTIAIDHVDGLFSGNQEVYLLDNTTGTETDLKAGAYTFTAAAGVDNARFSLKYQRTLGVNNAVFNDDSVTIHKNKGTLYVNSGAMVINNIKVFDIQGRLIAEQKNLKSNTATIKDLKATQQVLIVKVTSQDNKVVSKKVVN
jgi:hypothetical protein